MRPEPTAFAAHRRAELAAAAGGAPARLPSPGVLLGLYALLVVYGSLLPFELRAPPPEGAWQAFLQIRYLTLGVASRADWVANGLLYLPVGFLGMAWLAAGPRPWPAAVGRALTVWLGALGLAAAVEYSQIGFAPRTVSLNDLLAEAIGSAAGIGLWLAGRDWLGRQLGRLAAGGPLAIRGLLALYAVAYLALALFPFDLLVSDRELRWRLAGGGWGWLFAPNACGDGLRCGLGLVAEVLATVPFGVLLALEGRSRSLRSALVWGGGLGLLVEGLQLFIASGVSQGLSVLTRVAGTGLGLWAAAEVSRWGRRPVPPWVAPGVLLAGLVYLALALRVNGWFAAGWQGMPEALAKLKPQMFLPFYYHYFTTEAQAMQSLVANAGLYLPIGVGYWLWATASRAWPRAGVPAALAAVTAVVVEGGKLFLPGKHPDPTNILIAMVAAALGYFGMRWLTRQLAVGPAHGQAAATAPTAGPTAAVSMGSDTTAVPQGGSTVSDAIDRGLDRQGRWGPLPPRPRVRLGMPPGLGHLVEPQRGGPPPSPRSRAPCPVPPSVPRALAGLILLAVCAWGVAHYPLGAAWLALGLAAYAGLLWRWPDAWLVAVPAALPVLDFATWTGWVLVDELDLMLLVTVAVLLARTPRITLPALPRAFGWLLLAYSVAFAVSLTRGLLPLAPLDTNALSGYLSPWNALRVGKAWLWALALLPFLASGTGNRARPGPLGLLLAGVLLGLAATIALVVAERWMLPGLFNFGAEFRATAFLSSMHTGGASVDAYFALALPVVGACFLLWRSLACLGVGLALFAAGLYAVLVTFSRIDYAALAVSGAILLLAFARDPGSERRFFAVVLPGALIAALVAVPVFLGPYAHVRLLSVADDARIRLAHWEEVLRLQGGDTAATFLGAGIGSFPRVFFWAEPGPRRPGTFRFVREGNDAFLRLGAGQPVYVLQRVRPPAAGRYAVELAARSAQPNAELRVVVCEKSLLYSVACESLGWRLGAGAPAWSSHVAGLDLSRLGRYGRPVFVALYNPVQGTAVDVDAIRVLSPKGEDLLANGDFSAGAERWFFTSDDHLSWHVKNLWVHVLFEQGWLGVLLFTALAAYVLVRLGRAAWAKEPGAVILLAALAGGLTVGLTDAVLDAPRVALLLYLLLLAGATPLPGPGPEVSRSRPRGPTAPPSDITQTRRAWAISCRPGSTT